MRATRMVGLLEGRVARYLLTGLVVAATFALRLLLVPYTGTGAPFVVFFAAILVVSLFLGKGPGLFAVLLSVPLAAPVFVVRAGYPVSQAIFQSLLFVVDGLVVVYVTWQVKKGRLALETANERLRGANERSTRSESLTRDLIDLAPDAFFLSDLDGRVTEVNRAAADLLGCAPGELIGKTIVDTIREEDVPRLWKTRDELQRGGVHIGEWTQRHKDGTPIPVEVSARILADGRWLAFVRDIRERRRVEHEREQLLARERLAREAAEEASDRLRESEERFRLTLDEAPIGMAIVALDGRFMRVNRALCEIVGYEPAELTGLTFQAITHPDDLDKDLALLGRLERGEIPRYQLEKRYLRKDGTVVDILLNVSILRSPGGEPLTCIAQIEDITERKRAEDALRQSESRFRGLIEHLPDAVFLCQGGRIAYANQAFATLLRCDQVEVLLESALLELFPQQDRPRVVDRICSIQQTGLPAPPQELRIVRRDGSLCSVEVVALQVSIEGRPGIVVVVRDLTERKRAEEALRASEAKFSGIISISADAIVGIDEDQRITIYNDGAATIFGYSKEEAIGAPLDLLLPERFRGIHRRHVEAFAGGRATARRMGERLATIAGRRKNGEEFPAEASISKLEVGGTTLLTVALRDVTERKRVEQEQQFLVEAAAALASSLDYEQTLARIARLVVRSLADMCIVDLMSEGEELLRLTVAHADPAKAAACEALARLPLDPRRFHLAAPVLETKRPVVQAELRPEFVAANAQSPEHRRLLRELDPRSTLTVPLLAHGRFLGALVFASSRAGRYGPRDLPLAEELARRAATAIENARLYEEAHRATRARDELLAIVAHDLRNPLSSIRLAAQILERQLAQEGERRGGKSLETIERSLGRAQRLIEDLLDVNRIEAGQLAIERRALDAEQLVVDAAETQQVLASGASLELRLELKPGLPALWADRDRLLQVIENLVGNAVKFTPPGGRVTVEASARSGDVLFSVADTGPGIPVNHLPHVFDRFWQGERAERRGAGLGLTICKGIVEAHGGRIWAESAPGRGTTILFTIPAVAGVEAQLHC